MESGSIFRKLISMAGAWISPLGKAKGSRRVDDLLGKWESLAGILMNFPTTLAGDDPTLFYRNITLALSDLFRPDMIALLVTDGGGRAYLPLIAIPPDRNGSLDAGLDQSDAIIREFRSGKPYTCSPPSATGRNAGSSACYHFPLIVNGIVDAVLFMSARNLSPLDCDLISAFCRQTALVIHHKKTSRTLSCMLQQARSLAESSSEFGHVQAEKDLLRVILDKCADLLKAERGSLVLVDQEDQSLLLLKAIKGEVRGLAEETRINRGEGITGTVAEVGQPMLVENLEQDPRTMRKNRHSYRTRSFVSVPIRIEDRTIGVINVADKKDGTAFTDDDLKIVQSIAAQAALAIDRALLRSKIEELKRLSATDQLTGLVNRRYIFDRLRDELARTQRSGRELSILMLDLDGFKRCNDRLGHLFGDHILIQTAKTLLASVRSMDVVARYGGDEFLILLPEASEAVAAQIAERIRAAVDDLDFCREAREGGEGLSTSIGLVSFPAQGDTLEALLSHADAALYRAKKNGKNRVEIMR